MIRTVWKYKLGYDITLLQVPDGAEPLSVQKQPDGFALWMMVDPTAAPVERRFVCRGTGWGFFPAEGDKYISTVQESDGTVWHFFDLGVS